jgi:glutamate-1-semialdehyde aminotransferase
MMGYLIAHEDEIYPRLAALGEKARRIATEAFANEGIYATTPRYCNDVLQGSSISLLAFPYREGQELYTPGDVRDPSLCDVALQEEILHLALLAHDVFTKHGIGSVSTAHTEEDLEFFGQACGQVARLFRKHL